MSARENLYEVTLLPGFPANRLLATALFILLALCQALGIRKISFQFSGSSLGARYKQISAPMICVSVYIYELAKGPLLGKLKKESDA